MAAQVGHGQERRGERKPGWFLCGKLSNRDTAKSFGDVRRAILVHDARRGQDMLVEVKPWLVDTTVQPRSGRWQWL